LYFVTTPHRWITLGLVALDPDRRDGRGKQFAVLAVLAGVLVLGIHAANGAFICLLLVDAVWNGWHFAAQHQGVLALLGRAAGAPGQRWDVRWGVRFFVCYVIARTLGWTTGWLEARPEWADVLAWCDFAALAVPATLLVRAVAGCSRRQLAQTVYLTSVC